MDELQLSEDEEYVSDDIWVYEYLSVQKFMKNSSNWQKNFLAYFDYTLAIFFLGNLSCVKAFLLLTQGAF